MKTMSGPEVFTFQSSMIVNNAIAREPTPEQKALFKAAMHTLKLEPAVRKVHMTPNHPTSDRFTLTNDQRMEIQEAEQSMSGINEDLDLDEDSDLEEASSASKATSSSSGSSGSSGSSSGGGNSDLDEDSDQAETEATGE